MTTEQKPSIGRIVHYINERQEHRPAIITFVHSDFHVNLHVFKDYEDLWRDDHSMAHIPKYVLQDETCRDKLSWHWPERV